MLKIIIVNSEDKRNRLKHLKKNNLEIRTRQSNIRLSIADTKAENLKNEPG